MCTDPSASQPVSGINSCECVDAFYDSDPSTASNGLSCTGVKCAACASNDTAVLIPWPALGEGCRTGNATSCSVCFDANSAPFPTTNDCVCNTGFYDDNVLATNLTCTRRESCAISCSDLGLVLAALGQGCATGSATLCSVCYDADNSSASATTNECECNAGFRDSDSSTANAGLSCSGPPQPPPPRLLTGAFRAGRGMRHRVHGRHDMPHLP